MNDSKQKLPIGMSVAGMILGIISLLFFGLLSPVGLIISLTALKSCKKQQAAGKGMAITGVVTNIIGFIFYLIFLFFILVNMLYITNVDPIGGITALENSFYNGLYIVLITSSLAIVIYCCCLWYFLFRK